MIVRIGGQGDRSRACVPPFCIVPGGRFRRCFDVTFRGDVVPVEACPAYRPNNTDEREFVEFARHLRRERITRAAISINTNPATAFPATGSDAPVEAISRLRVALWRQHIRVRVMDFGLKQRRLAVPQRGGLGRMMWRWLRR